MGGRRLVSSSFVLLPENFPVLQIVIKFSAEKKARLIITNTDPSGRAVYGVGLRPLACWDCGFEFRRGHGCLSLVSDMWCQVEVSASGWSHVQRSPTKCGVSECDREASIMRRSWPTRGWCDMEEKNRKVITNVCCVVFSVVHCKYLLCSPTART
jgi:hypothetical protein